LPSGAPALAQEQRLPYAGEDSGLALESASGLSRNDFPPYGKNGGGKFFLAKIYIIYIFSLHLKPLNPGMDSFFGRESKNLTFFKIFLLHFGRARIILVVSTLLKRVLIETFFYKTSGSSPVFEELAKQPNKYPKIKK